MRFLGPELATFVVKEKILWRKVVVREDGLVVLLRHLRLEEVGEKADLFVELVAVVEVLGLQTLVFEQLFLPFLVLFAFGLSFPAVVVFLFFHHELGKHVLHGLARLEVADRETRVIALAQHPLVLKIFLLLLARIDLVTLLLEGRLLVLQIVDFHELSLESAHFDVFQVLVLKFVLVPQTEVLHLSC